MTGTKPNLDEINIRTQLLPGDLGYMAYLHGRLYKEECGYGLSFERYVLEGLAELTARYNPKKDRVWICEHKTQIVGFLAGVNHGDHAQLRYFLLMPQYRGIGLGTKLMDLFISYLFEQGIHNAFLWTTNEQETATVLYKKYGFHLTQEKSSTAFDKPLLEQRYDLDLTK